MTIAGRPAVALLLGALAVPLVACVEEAPSLHPLFASSENVPEVLGTWLSEDDGIPIRLEEKSDGYRITVDHPDFRSLTMNARFGRLGGEWYLDASADVHDSAESGMWPVHVFAKVRLSPGRMEIARLDQKWLNRMLSGGVLFLAHAALGEDVVLTAPTSELQSFIAEWAHHPDAFLAPDVWVRPATPQEAAP